MSSTFICKDTTRIFLGKLPTSWHGRNLNLRGLHGTAWHVQWWLESHAQWRSNHHLVRRASSSGVASCRVSRAPSRSGWARNLNLNELAPVLRPRTGPGRVTGSALPGRSAGPCWAPAVGGQSRGRGGRGDPAPLAPQAEAEARTGSAAACPGRWFQRAWLGSASASGCY